MILENLELDHREEAQAELQELAETLRVSGFNVEVAPLDGEFHAKLEESAERVFLDVLNVVLQETEDHALEAVIGAIITALTNWALRRKHFRDREDGRATAVIWGSDGRELRRVSLPKPDETQEND
jgi:hypothetical protein